MEDVFYMFSLLAREVFLSFWCDFVWYMVSLFCLSLFSLILFMLFFFWRARSVSCASYHYGFIAMGSICMVKKTAVIMECVITSDLRQLCWAKSLWLDIV